MSLDSVFVLIKGQPPGTLLGFADLAPFNRDREEISLSFPVDNLSKLPGAVWNTTKENIFNYYAREVIL